MSMLKKPSTNIFRRVDEKEDIWALDSSNDVFFPEHKILMDLGKILERVYTMTPDHFNGVFNKAKQNLN